MQLAEEKCILAQTKIWKVSFLVHIMWPPANWITQNMSPDDVLNCVKHTLPCNKFLNAHWRQDNNDSRAQERKDHMLSTKTLKSHATRDYTVSHSGKANNGLHWG